MKKNIVPQMKNWRFERCFMTDFQTMLEWGLPGEFWSYGKTIQEALSNKQREWGYSEIDFSWALKKGYKRIFVHFSRLGKKDIIYVRDWYNEEGY